MLSSVLVSLPAGGGATGTGSGGALGRIGGSVGSWGISGFQQPVGLPNTYQGEVAGVTSNTTWNTIKGGQAVPLKFEIFAGGTEKTSVSDVHGIYLYSLPCTVGEENPVLMDMDSSGDTELRYTDGHFIQNWKTPKGANKCYRVVLRTKDGSALTAFFKTK